MLAYFVLTLFLLVLAYCETENAGSPVPLALGALAVILFVGLRFETGADWVEYEKLLAMTPPIFDRTPMYQTPGLIVEPGFALLLAVFSTLGLSIQSLLFFSAAFSVTVLAVFLRRYGDRPVTILLWYCGFALLFGQMAVIRQVIAYAFLFLAFMSFDRGRLAASVLLSVVAVTMHVFAIALIPVIFLRLRPPRTVLVIALCAAGLVISFIGVNVFALLVSPVSAVLGEGLVGTKLEIYNAFAPFAVSPATVFLIVWHAGVLLLINRPALGEWATPAVRLGIYAAIWSLAAHTVFATLPAFWNRLMLFTMPVELLALFRCYHSTLRLPSVRGLAPAATWLVSTASIGYGLSQESALPYLPYQSVVQVWATGDIGDGRLRYQIEQSNLDRRVDEQSRP